ncbi:MAG: VOC family protein [Anaerolineae bacterium]|nr:MAG: VOC family protein [Anaerolineae bacterium]
MLKNLVATHIYVKDQNEALRFFTEKLGFEIRADVTNGDFRWLSVGLKDQPDLQFGLLALKPGGPLNEEDVTVLTKLVEEGKLGAGVWKTDDCRATYEHLKAKGVEFIIPPTDRPYGMTEAVFKDNSGNVFVLQSDR